MRILTHVCSEPLTQVELFLRNTRRVYPAAPLTMIGDGVDGDYRELAGKYAAEFVAGEALKRIHREPRWTCRLFSVMGERPDDWYLLLDPDTRLWRPFHEPFPDADLIGMRTPDPMGFVMTSCALRVRRSFVERFNAEAWDASVLWPRLPEPYKQRMREMQAYAQDMWLPTMAAQLSAQCVDDGEVLAVWLPRRLEITAEIRSGTYAATHPHRGHQSWM